MGLNVILIKIYLIIILLFTLIRNAGTHFYLNE